MEVTHGPRTLLTTACTYPVAEGITVKTDTEEVQEARRFVMDLLLSRCPEVPALQVMAQELGLAEPSYPKGDSDCILCGKCVRMCHEVQHASAIAMMGRGAKREVMTPFGDFSATCRTCGACLFVCPTGHINDLAKISGKTPKPSCRNSTPGCCPGQHHSTLPPGGARTAVIDRTTASTSSPVTAASAPRSAPPGPLTTSSRMKRSPWKWAPSSWRRVLRPSTPAASRPTATASFPMSIPAWSSSASSVPAARTHGHVVRRSDGKEPEKIAWLHCVGMRSDREGEHPYCSNFCCMVALKQAVIAREHIGEDLDMALFYMDMRTPRKDFEKYMVRIKDQGARLIRSRVHTVSPVGANGDLEVRYVTEAGESDEIFDQVVLSVGDGDSAGHRGPGRETGDSAEPQ